MENTFKTLVNEKGEYCGISHDGFGVGKGKNKIYKSNVPSLMGIKVTIDSLKKCYPNIDYTNLKIIRVLTVKIDEL